MSGLREGGPASTDDAGRLSDLAQHAWSVRYSDPTLFARRIALVPASPLRSVLEAFVSWRESRLDVSLDTTMALAEDGSLPPTWACRSLNLQSIVLDELGLHAEAVHSQELALEAARESGSLVAVAAATHDLAAVLDRTDPPRALAIYLRTLELCEQIRATLPREEVVRAGIGGLEAIAVVNLHDTHARAGVGDPATFPTLADAEVLADLDWPELRDSIRARRVLALLPTIGSAVSPEPGVAADLRPLAAALPLTDHVRDPHQAAFVARANARRAVASGDLSGAARTLDRTLRRLPPRVALGLLDDLSEVHELSGDVRSAIAAERRKAEVVVETHASDAQTAVRALEVWHRTRRAEEAAATHLAQAAKLRAQMTELHHDRETLRARSHRDVLTGLWNRQHLHDTVRTLDPTQPHQVAVIDIDHFKTVNDTNGHTIGDDVLRRLADALHDVAGPHDTCVRYGGDEIIVIRPATAPGHLAHDLAVITHLPPHDALALPAITTSIGIARTTTTFRDALDHADQLMYTAKRSGGGILLDDPTGDPLAGAPVVPLAPGTCPDGPAAEHVGA